jgi:hypothetical protein
MRSPAQRNRVITILPHPAELRTLESWLIAGSHLFQKREAESTPRQRQNASDLKTDRDTAEEVALLPHRGSRGQLLGKGPARPWLSLTPAVPSGAVEASLVDCRQAGGKGLC